MIEKLKIHSTFCGAETMISNKINEIIDKLNEESDVEFSKETWVVLPGTFEWALLQMKNGKKVGRKSCDCGCCYFSSADSMTNDWEIM